MAKSPLELLRAALPQDYEVQKPLKAGGQGAVFLGKYKGNDVALKILKPTANPERIERELSLLPKISCKHLVKLISENKIDIQGQMYPLVAYEFYAGGDLRKFCQNGTAIEETELVKIGCNISCAVESLWPKRIVHRDIKPDNIVKSIDGDYILVDVGLAKHLDLTDLTTPGGAPGTEGYKSPEQAQGRRYLTINSDIFSLGITLYELACQKHPFDKIQSNIGKIKPKPPKDFRSDLSKPFSDLVVQMISVRPSRRPFNIKERFKKLAGGV